MKRRIGWSDRMALMVAVLGASAPAWAQQTSWTTPSSPTCTKVRDTGDAWLLTADSDAATLKQWVLDPALTTGGPAWYLQMAWMGAETAFRSASNVWTAIVSNQERRSIAWTSEPTPYLSVSPAVLPWLHGIEGAYRGHWQGEAARLNSDVEKWARRSDKWQLQVNAWGQTDIANQTVEAALRGGWEGVALTQDAGEAVWSAVQSNLDGADKGWVIAERSFDFVSRGWELQPGALTPSRKWIGTPTRSTQALLDQWMLVQAGFETDRIDWLARSAALEDLGLAWLKTATPNAPIRDSQSIAWAIQSLSSSLNVNSILWGAQAFYWTKAPETSSCFVLGDEDDATVQLWSSSTINSLSTQTKSWTSLSTSTPSTSWTTTPSP